MKIDLPDEDGVIKALLAVSEYDGYVEHFYPKLVVDLEGCETADNVAAAFISAGVDFLREMKWRRDAEQALNAMMPRFIEAVLAGQVAAAAEVLRIVREGLTQAVGEELGEVEEEPEAEEEDEEEDD